MSGMDNRGRCMAIRYFKGQVDFDRLSLEELSEFAGALSVIERTAAKHGFQFETGSSRRSVPRPERGAKRADGRPKQQARLILAMRGKEGMSYGDIELATGMKPGSINPHLSALFKEGLISKTKGPGLPEGRRGRPGNLALSYTLTEEGLAVADALAADAGGDPG